MEYDQLKRLVRESYPFPIAHAHKKTLGLLDDDAQKLKCLIETAENTMQFLALTALAQLWHDLRQGSSRDSLASMTPSGIISGTLPSENGSLSCGM